MLVSARIGPAVKLCRAITLSSWCVGACDSVSMCACMWLSVCFISILFSVYSFFFLVSTYAPAGVRGTKHARAQCLSLNTCTPSGTVQEKCNNIQYNTISELTQTPGKFWKFAANRQREYCGGRSFIPSYFSRLRSRVHGEKCFLVDLLTILTVTGLPTSVQVDLA